ncbi:MAG: polysaccharide pyruvyl transferase family protein [Nitrospirae bacterium]|nr:polysaccharide pyruvyl transferase family protein [Nitrospirota bacterium]
MKTLVAGWFSFEQMGATVGDLLTRDLVCQWLSKAGLDYDMAVAPPFDDGVYWASVDPQIYSHVIFVCGPFGNGWPIPEFLTHFKGCRLIGLNLSMIESLDTWNPFDLLWERDSSHCARPDLSFLSSQAPVPVVGVILADQQKEYREKSLHHIANDYIHQLINSRPMAVVNIDTRLDNNQTGLRTPSEVESLIARMDVVLTTRLHGTVLALKNGVPAIVIDPIAGGSKVQRQAATLGWQTVFIVDSLDNRTLQQAFEYCLSGEARAKTRVCSEEAERRLQKVKNDFISAMPSSVKWAKE